MNFKIRDFNNLVFSEKLRIPYDPMNPDMTTNQLCLTQVYRLNPITNVAALLSGFLPEYWKDYNTYIWLDIGTPDTVSYHIQNHYRAVALTILKKTAVSMLSLKSIINILTGNPFFLVPGIIRVTHTEGEGAMKMISQYGYATVLPEDTVTPTMTYVFPIGLPCSLTTGTYVEQFSPIIDVVDVYDINDGDAWLSQFDVVSPSDPESLLDYEISHRKIVGAKRIRLSQFTYNSKMLFKYLRGVIKKDIIFLYKEIANE